MEQNNKQSWSTWLKAENWIKRMPFMLFLIFLALVYIANAHYHIKLERKIDNLSQDLKNQRWEYLSVKNELMFKSKQSEVADLAENIGLKPLTSPPKKILVAKSKKQN